MAAPKITTGYTQPKPGTKLIVKPDIANYKDTKKYQTALTNFYANSSDPEAVKYRTDELTKKYGSLKDADGKAIFTPTYIKALAEGVEPPASLDKAVTDWATAKMKEATNYDWNNFSGGIGSVAAQNLLSSFVKDPSQVDTALTFKSSGADVTPEQKQANAVALQDKTAKAEKDTAALENYDPNAGTWDPSKNTQATPFGDVLSGLISGYKNPYAANYVNPLAAVEKPNLTNIQTPFNKNAIPQDLVSLFNSAGTNYAGGTRANPLVRPTLPNNGLVKLTQPSATESAEQLAKPGAPDTTNTTLPVVTDKIAADKIAADKIAADKIAADKIAADKIAADKIAADKIAAEKLAAGKMKWVQDLQTSLKNPVDYYTALANNTLYADLAATGKEALTSYADVQAKALNTPSTAGQPTGQPQQFTLTSPNDPQPVTIGSGVEGVVDSSKYPQPVTIGSSTPKPQQFTLTSPNDPQPVTIGSGVEGVVDSSKYPQPVTIGSSTPKPQQFTLTSPNDPQPVTISSSPYNQSGVGTLPAGQNVVKDVTNTALTNGNLGASLVNQQAQAAAVPVNSSQMTALQSLQNQPGMTAEKYYAALAADPAYAAAGNSGIAALAAQKNQPAPIVLPAPQGKPQTFTLT